MLLYSLVILLVFCVILKVNLRKKTSLDPPDLPGWLPIIGHAHLLMGNSVKMLKSILKLADDCIVMGGVVTLYLGSRKFYGVTDPDDCVTIMNVSLQKNMFYKFAKPLLGDGLVTADVPTWKRNRKLLNPAYNQHVLDGFIDVFNSQAKKIVQKFANEVGKPFDHENLLRINNLETICTTSFGVFAKDSEYSEIFKKYLSHLVEIMKLVNERIQKFWLHSDYIYKITGGKKRLDEEVEHLTALSKLILHKKKIERTNQSKLKNNTEKLKPFIDLILDLADENDCFTDKQIQWETETAIAAGHDTVATTLTFILAVLGSNPDVQERAYEEICDVFQDSGNTVNKEDLNKLIYLEAVIKEVLRLYNISSLITRTLDRDIKLKNYTLKTNSDCLILLHSIHRHSIWGPNAKQFKPERWLDKETLPDPKYYGSFGMGRRACIGKSYAIMAMKIYLTHVLKTYHISSDISEMVIKMHALIRPHSGHYITLTYRNML